MIEINCPIEVKFDELKNTDTLYFIYESTEKLKVIKPFTYTQIKNRLNARVEESIRDIDRNYRKHFLDHHASTSFIHASIAGFSSYYKHARLFDTENYTYYFKLTPSELKDCCFSITNESGEITDITPGIPGILSVLKKWQSNKNIYPDIINLTEASFCYSQINIVIPFKVKPIFILPPTRLREYYHGSVKRLDVLSEWTYVTPYKLDAISFGVPWDSNDLVYCENEESEIKGRPPHQLVFKSNVTKPEDSKIFIYKIKDNKTIGAKTNTDEYYPWNRVLVNKCDNFEIEEIDSWKDYFKIKR